jgi:hypothetical protein
MLGSAISGGLRVRHKVVHGGIEPLEKPAWIRYVCSHGPQKIHALGGTFGCWAPDGGWYEAPDGGWYEAPDGGWSR